MNEKLIKHLGNSQLELNIALYNERKELSDHEMNVLREAQQLMPLIIARLEREDLCAKTAGSGSALLPVLKGINISPR